MEAVTQALLDQPNLTVITATRRLSRQLLHEFNQHQSQTGLTFWETPDILPWAAWIERLWQESLILQSQPPRRCSDWQSRLLWEAIIESHSDDLLNVSAMATSAQQCRELIIDWQLPLDDAQIRTRFQAVSDSQAWMSWHGQYQSHCQQQQVIDRAAVLPILLALGKDHAELMAGDFTFIGFDEMTPLQTSLLEQMQSSGSVISNIENPLVETNASLVCATDELDEIRQAAQWSRKQFEQQWQTGDLPIAVIVPSISQQRQAVERIFREVFYPLDGIQTLQDNVHGQGVRRECVFNLSMGLPLTDEPIIQAFFDALALCSGQFEAGQISTVLRSPFLRQSMTGQFRRARWDERLRRQGRTHWTLVSLIKELDYLGAIEEDAFMQLLRYLQQRFSDSPGRATHTAWAGWMNETIRGLGWPGGRTLDAHEMQVMEAFDTLLTDFSRLDGLAISKSALITLNKASRQLSRMAREQVFQAGAAQLPVQVMGIIEASGLQFSSLWVCGMNDRSWPPAPRPNAFIPISLQRERLLPHASPQREYEYARLQTERLLGSALETIFSYATVLDEQPARPSSFVADLPLRESAAVQGQAFESVALETINDSQGPAIDEDESKVGTTVIKDQSQCPFRAFVHHRLSATQPEQPEPGMDPRTRGNLVHLIMEKLWTNWQNQQGLCSRSDKQMQEELLLAIDEVMKQQALIEDDMTTVERERLRRLLGDWIALEKQRQPFAIQATEQKTEYQLAQLKVSMRIDRIDVLEDGSLSIIDYKTGKSEVKSWCGERPDEPQLPLYAMAQGETQTVNSVLFANVRAGENNWIGLTSDKQQLSANDKSLRDIKQLPAKGRSACNIYEDWQALLDEWQAQLNTLAQAYAEGAATIDPKNGLTSCLYCDLTSVCRMFDVWQEEDVA